MNREAFLPAVFAGLQGKVQYVRQVAKDEWSSSCPNCGGTTHKNGEFPDRFRMWTNARGKNKILGWCRHCSYVWFPDTEKPPSREEFDAWRKEQIQVEEQRKREAERAIALLKSEKVWMLYHERLNDWAKEVIKSWGIREDWAHYWKLGLIEDYIVYSKTNGEYHTPAISIPVWQRNWDVANVKIRTLNPKGSEDRYRSMYKVGQAFPFVSFPALDSDTVLVVEGEKKAMVSAQWSEEKYQVIGIPSKTPNPEVLRVLDNFGKVIICLDPDAKEVENENGISALDRLTKIVGRERVAVLDLPDKVDDMIIRGLKINSALKYAKKLEAK